MAAFALLLLLLLLAIAAAISAVFGVLFWQVLAPILENKRGHAERQLSCWFCARGWTSASRLLLLGRAQVDVHGLTAAVTLTIVALR